jgi:hypothetical protein
LVNLRARYYDPKTAQFLTRDPLDTLTRSAYGYVNDNPINGTDPTGLVAPGGCYTIKECSSKSYQQHNMWSHGSYAGFAGGAVIGAGVVIGADCAFAVCQGASELWNSFTDLFNQLCSNNETGAIGAGGYEPVGAAADFSRDELAQLIYQHIGEGDIAGRPTLDEIANALRLGEVTPIEGQNAVQVNYGGVRIIVNQDLPTRTAYYP